MQQLHGELNPVVRATRIGKGIFSVGSSQRGTVSNPGDVAYFQRRARPTWTREDETVAKLDAVIAGQQWLSSIFVVVVVSGIWLGHEE